MGGTPFLANAQSALFYPPHLLFYVLPFSLAWSLMFGLHAVLAGFFTFLFLKAIDCDDWSAIAGGLIFSLCGFVTVWRGYPIGEAAIWMPLVFFGIVRLRQEPSARALVLTATALAMPVLAGHPETAIHVAMVGTGYALMEWLLPTSEARTLHDYVLFPGLFAGAALLAIALSSAQLLPSLEWVSYTYQNTDSRWPVRPLTEFFAFVSRDILANPNSAGIAVPEGAVYSGMLSLMLAPLAFLRGIKRPLFFVAIGCASFLIAYGIGPLNDVLQSIPVVASLKNSRFLLITNFSIAVLAALGLSSLVVPVKQTVPYRNSSANRTGTLLLRRSRSSSFLTGISDLMVGAFLI